MEETTDYDFGMTLSYPFPLFSHPKLKKATPTSTPKLIPKSKPIEANREETKYNYKYRTRTNSVSSLGSFSSTDDTYTPALSFSSTPRNSVSITNSHDLPSFTKNYTNSLLFDNELKEVDEISDSDLSSDSSKCKDFKRIFDDEDENSRLATFTENTAKNLLFGVCVGLLVVNSVTNQIFNRKEDENTGKVDDEVEPKC